MFIKRSAFLEVQFRLTKEYIICVRKRHKSETLKKREVQRLEPITMYSAGKPRMSHTATKSNANILEKIC